MTNQERHADGFLHRTIDVGEVRLHVAEARPGGPSASAPAADVPLVVFLHGFPEFWWSWRHQLVAFARAGMWAVAPDLRGYNDSDKPGGVAAYETERLTGDVAGLIRALGRTKAFVVGHDWGAVIAWLFASDHPEMVERLAILNVPHPVVMMEGVRRPAQAKRSWYILFFQLPRLPERAIARDDHRWLRRLFGADGFPPGDVERYVDAMRVPGATTAAINYYRAMGRRLLSRRVARVARIDVPVLVIWGDRDRYLGAEMAEPPPRLVPNARVVHLPEASHWVQNAAPEEVNRLLIEHVRGVSSYDPRMAGPVELTTDCATCLLEAGVVEVYDALEPACRFGLPATARCKLCGEASTGRFDRPLARALRDVPANRCPSCLEELGPAAIDHRRCGSCGATATLDVTATATRFETLADLDRALDAWAAREQFPTRQELVRATFTEPESARVFGRIQRGERLEILADPFANMGVRTTGGAVGDRPPTPAARTAPGVAAAPFARPPAVVAEPRRPSDWRPEYRRSSAPPAAPVARGGAAERSVPSGGAVDALAPTAPLTAPIAVAPPPRSAPPRAIVYPLVSVIAADGEIHPEERALVDRFLESEGLPPLAEEEYRVHHPSEVAHFVPRERREDVVKLMCESAAVDGMPDESERRVIRAYATAWGVDDEKLEFWMWGYESMNTSVTRGLWLKLRRFVLSARWSETEAP